MTSPPDLTLLRARNETLERQLEELSRLKSGGGGGTSGGMEARVAKLEASVDHIQKDIAEIKSDVREFRTSIGALNSTSATLTERVSHLPTKGFIVTCLVTSLGVVAALIVFQTSIQALLKLPH